MIKEEKKIWLSTVLAVVCGVVFAFVIASAGACSGQHKEVYTPGSVTFDMQGGMTDIAGQTVEVSACVRHDFAIMETFAASLRVCYLTTSFEQDGVEEQIHCALGEVDAIGGHGQGVMTTGKYKERCSAKYGGWSFVPAPTHTEPPQSVD